jgi:hypothetical protein
MRKSDNEKFALKKISLHFLNPAERRMAENEVQLLKVDFITSLL